MELYGIEEGMFCQFINSINKRLKDNAHREIENYISFLLNLYKSVQIYGSNEDSGNGGYCGSKTQTDR